MSVLNTGDFDLSFLYSCLRTQESELNRLTQAREAELKYLREQNDMEINKTRNMAEIETSKFQNMVHAIGADTIQAIATAGPEMQVGVM